MYVCVCVYVGQKMAKLQVACVTSLTGDDSLELKAAEDSLAVRRAASADVEAICSRSVIPVLKYSHYLFINCGES